MTALTSSDLFRIVRIESWTVARKVPGISSRMRRQMLSIIRLLSWKSVSESPSPIRLDAP
jgi:hypothetical protein